jgi:hypothetical protein
MKKIYLSEAQVKTLMLLESSKEISKELEKETSKRGLRHQVRRFLMRGVSAAVLVAALMSSHNLGHEEADSFVGQLRNEMREKYDEYIKRPRWALVASDVTATVYNAVPEQCNNDISNTASMFRLNLDDVLSHRIIAMERTMMAEFGFKYGDVVKIEGTGKWDGIWQIQDTMNKRFAGKHKIDILIPQGAGLGEWENVKLYRLENPDEAVGVRDHMAPQLSKAQAKKQMERIRAEA